MSSWDIFLHGIFSWWDFVLWDFVLWDFVLWDFVLMGFFPLGFFPYGIFSYMGFCPHGILSGNPMHPWLICSLSFPEEGVASKRLDSAPHLTQSGLTQSCNIHLESSELPSNQRCPPLWTVRILQVLQGPHVPWSNLQCLSMCISLVIVRVTISVLWDS